MMIAESLIILDLMSDFASGYDGANALGPLELLVLVGLLLVHPRVRLPAFDRAARGRIEYLEKRVEKLISWQCELENYAESEGIHYRDIILRTLD